MVTGRWNTIATATTADGPLELNRHDSGAFLIMIDGRVLMDSHANRSEVALGELACHDLPFRDGPRVLCAGLGMGCTLRAALDTLPQDASVEVCELNEAIVRWCRGPLASVNGDVLSDGRVQVHDDDVAAHIARRADDPDAPRFDCIILDLNVGPHASDDAATDPFYGAHALARTRCALSAGGVLAVWGETHEPAFERRLANAGFHVEVSIHGRGGRKHAVYLAKLPG